MKASIFQTSLFQAPIFQTSTPKLQASILYSNHLLDVVSLSRSPDWLRLSPTSASIPLLDLDAGTPMLGALASHCVTSRIFLRDKHEKKASKIEILASAKRNARLFDHLSHTFPLEKGHRLRSDELTYTLYSFRTVKPLRCQSRQCRGI